MEAGAAAIINPGVCGCGGIFASMKLAAMADPYAVGFSPHNHNTTVVGLAATAHVSLAVSNFVMTGYFVNFSVERCFCGATAGGRERLVFGAGRARTGRRHQTGGFAQLALSGIGQRQVHISARKVSAAASRFAVASVWRD
ncbi:enolase C-terminal domain-like protein [Pseudomonas cerasi]|uniref:enolase C-terminal domain-like protein n=1 Tax=Pseudomonas cerasi TaxID=1583341 RepID=UPI000806A77C|nr:enolase C-terminal domain-like protein [Pseudomonas cerasi]